MPTPEGAFTPSEDAGASAHDAGKRDAQVSLPDSARPKPSEAGPSADARTATDVGPTDDGADSGSPPDPAQARVQALSGRYLMRFDTYGTASSGSGLTALELHSRTSLLLIAELASGQGGLEATERLCSQVYEHECVRGCTSATTALDPGVIDGFLLSRFFARNYRLDADGLVTGEPSVLQLGYDDSSGATPPTSSSDARVWDVVPGGAREGLLTQLTVKTALGNVSCGLYSVADFRASFQGRLDGPESAPRFPEMTLSLDGSGGALLGASSATCATQDAKDGPLERASARLVRYGAELSDESFWRCPSSSVFDELLPPAPL